jgi:gamma-glutamyltranspeptidase
MQKVTGIFLRAIPLYSLLASRYSVQYLCHSSAVRPAFLPGSIILPTIVVSDSLNGASGGALQAVMQAKIILEGMKEEKQAQDIIELRDQQADVREQLEKQTTKYSSVLNLRHLHDSLRDTGPSSNSFQR